MKTAKTVFLATIFLGAFATAAQATPASVRRFRFTYRFDMKPVAGAKKIAVWIPLPVQSKWQSVSNIDIKASVPFKVARENVYGNRMVYLEHGPNDRWPFRAILSFLVERREYRGQPAQRPSGRYLSANRLVPVTGLIKQLSDRVTAGHTSAIEKARAIYEYVTDTVSYDKSGTGWGRGDALFACTRKKGNCTDFHALFIALARAAGIPARFEIGFPIPRDAHEGSIPGYHCWAEFWVEGRGWIPVDSSEAHKHPELRDYYFGTLDPNRVQMSTGRDIVLSPRQKGEPLNYFVYPYVEIDGRPLKDHDLVTVSFSFADKPD